jgi:hypothetical protein
MSWPLLACVIAGVPQSQHVRMNLELLPAADAARSIMRAKSALVDLANSPRRDRGTGRGANKGLPSQLARVATVDARSYRAFRQRLSEAISKTIATRKTILASPTAVPAMPPKPSKAAITTGSPRCGAHYWRGRKCRSMCGWAFSSRPAPAAARSIIRAKPRLVNGEPALADERE